MNDIEQLYFLEGSSFNDNNIGNELAQKILNKLDLIPTNERVIELSKLIYSGMFDNIRCGKQWEELNDEDINLIVDKTRKYCKKFEHHYENISNERYKFDEYNKIIE